MKTIKNLAAIFSIGIAALSTPNLIGAPLGTSFTYQGRLNNGANSVNGYYDFTFTLFDAGSGGSIAGSTITQPALAVSNGLFTTTLDFGNGIFTGDARWL